MKYQHARNTHTHFVNWPGFSLEVSNGDVATKLVGELNRLDVELVRTRQELEAVKRDLTLQVEAKNNYISLAASFVTAIRESQKILGDYLQQRPVVSDKRNLSRMRETINDLLGVLDHRDLVALVQGSSLGKEHIRKGSTMTAVHPLLGVVDLPVKPTWNDTRVSYWHTHLFYVPEDGWVFAREVFSDSEDSRRWVDSDTDASVTRMWFENNIVAGTLSERSKRKVEVSTLNDWEDATHQITFDGGKHWTNVKLEDGMYVACSDGKRSWELRHVNMKNVVKRPGDPLKSIVNAAEMGTMIHETLNRLTKAISETQLVTTIHLAPKPKASKKQLAALEEVIDYLEDEHPAPDTINHQLRKLLRKLS